VFTRSVTDERIDARRLWSKRVSSS